MKQGSFQGLNAVIQHLRTLYYAPHLRGSHPSPYNAITARGSVLSLVSGNCCQFFPSFFHATANGAVNEARPVLEELPFLSGMAVGGRTKISMNHYLTQCHVPKPQRSVTHSFC